jgi:hypothetical protein
MTSKAKTDWDAVEPIYCAGVVPIPTLCERFNCKKSRLCQVAKMRGWTRNLDGKIQQATQDKLNRALVVAEFKQNTKMSEHLAIEAVAKTNSELILKHRSDIAQYQSICDSLMRELTTKTVDQKVLIESINSLRKTLSECTIDSVDADGIKKQVEAVTKNLRLGLSGRADILRQLVEAKNKLVNIERQAFGIKDDAAEEKKAPVNFYLNMTGVTITTKENGNVIDGFAKTIDP